MSTVVAAAAEATTSDPENRDERQNRKKHLHGYTIWI